MIDYYNLSVRQIEENYKNERENAQHLFFASKVYEYSQAKQRKMAALAEAATARDNLLSFLGYLPVKENTV